MQEDLKSNPFLPPQEAAAELLVPGVRAECLLKFQLRPVMEWQRSAPNFPFNLATKPSLLLSSRAPCEQNPDPPPLLLLLLLLHQRRRPLLLRRGLCEGGVRGPRLPGGGGAVQEGLLRGRRPPSR